jgi:hypothetical protein
MQAIFVVHQTIQYAYIHILCDVSIQESNGTRTVSINSVYMWPDQGPYAARPTDAADDGTTNPLLEQIMHHNPIYGDWSVCCFIRRLTPSGAVHVNKAILERIPRAARHTVANLTQKLVQDLMRHSHRPNIMLYLLNEAS